MPRIPVLRRLRKEDHYFEARLVFIFRAVLVLCDRELGMGGHWVTEERPLEEGRSRD